MSATQAKAFAVLAQSAPSVEEKLNLMAKALAAIAMALENLPSQARR